MNTIDELLIDKSIEKYHESGFSKKNTPRGRFEKIHIVHYEDDAELEHFYEGTSIGSWIYSDDKEILKAEIPNQDEEGDEECVEAWFWYNLTEMKAYLDILYLPLCGSGYAYSILEENGNLVLGDERLECRV